MLNMNMTRLRTAAWNLTVTQGDPAAAVDLSGKVLWFFAKFDIDDSDASAALRKNSAAVGGVTVTDPVNGLATLTIVPADTAKIPLKTTTSLICSFVLVDGANVYELDSGTMVVAGNVEVPR